MPTVVNRVRRWLRRDRPESADAPAVATFAAPPKVIEAPAIGGGADGQAKVVPAADPTRSYVSGFGGRSYQGFGYGPGSATTLDAHASEVARELGPRILEAVSRDPDVDSALDVFVSAVLEGGVQLSPAVQADPTAGPDSDEANDPEVKLAAEIADYCRRLTDRVTVAFEASLYDQLRGKLVHGCKLAEMTAEVAGDGPDKGRLVLKSYRVKPNAAWAFLVDAALTVLGYVAKAPIDRRPDPTANGSATTTRLGGYVVLPPSKCVAMSRRPKDGDPRGTSVVDCIYTAWNFKAQTWGELGKYIVQFSSGMLVGVTAPGATAQAPRDAAGNPTGEPAVTPEQALATQMESARNGSCIALPAGGDVKILQPVGAGDPFYNAFGYCDRQIAKGILKQTRATQEAEHGSKADSQTGQDILGLPVRVEKRVVAADLKAQLYRPFVEWNFGKDAADRLTPNVSLGATEQQDMAAMLGAFAAVGYSIDPSQLPAIDHMLGLKVREPEPEPQPIAGPDEVAVAGEVGVAKAKADQAKGAVAA
jgi:hypothetical protein